MSDIQVKCIDQTLTITNAPLIASGGVLEDRIIFDFCPLWDNYTKTAVFYRDKDNIYPVELADDTCYIPNDVLREKGKIYFGVYGTAASDNSETAYVRTSEVLSYEIVQGIFAATNVPDPTPNIYEQLFEKLGILDSVLTKIDTAQQAAETAQAAAESALETIAQVEQNAEVAQQAAQNAQNAATNAVNTHNADETTHSDIREEINTHKQDTTKHITAAERTAWNAKQAALTFDTAPTEGSTNPVTSGGVKTALDGKAAQVLTGTSAPTNQTVGVEGQLYLNRNGMDVYVCTRVIASFPAYYWTKVITGRDVDDEVGTPSLRNEYFVAKADYDAETNAPTVEGQICWLYG